MKSNFEKKSLAVVIIVLFFGMSIIPSMVAERPVLIETIYVDDDNTEGPGDGTLVSTSFAGGVIPDENNLQELGVNQRGDGNTLFVGGSGPGNYSTIQGAIDNASDGDTVFVYNGTYYENVVINKSINLIGEDKNITIIDGGGTIFEYVVLISADRVSISSFTIQNCTGILENGIYIRKVSNVNISDNLISNNFKSILEDSSDNNTIFRNIIKNSVVGIFSAHSSYTYIKGNTFTNHTIGIELQNTSSHVIEGNTVSLSEKPELPKNTWGIAIRWSSNNIITENTITNHLWGIQCSNSSILNISFNDLVCTYFCIYVFQSSDFEINRNNVINSEFGVYLFDSNFNNIIKNNFIENSYSAFFEDSSFNRWIYNYWDDWIGFGPRLIDGEVSLPWNPSKTIRWFNFDWRPAKEPYDI